MKDTVRVLKKFNWAVVVILFFSIVSQKVALPSLHNNNINSFQIHAKHFSMVILTFTHPFKVAITELIL